MLFSQKWADFLKKAAAYYRFPIGEVFRTALPAGLSGKGNDVPILSDKLYSLVDPEAEPGGRKQRQIITLLRERGDLPLGELRCLVSYNFV